MASTLPFKKVNSVGVRFWHWTNLLLISGSLITVLINSTLLDKPSNAILIKSQLQESGALVNDEQANAVSHALREEVWSYHIYFGYAIAALFLFRLISELFLRKDQKLSGKLKLSYKNYLYAIFYLLLTVMVCTGISIAFKNELGIPKSFSHDLKEIHGFCMYLILAFILVHLVGVFLGERKDQKGIVSGMINGGELDNRL